jgi:hypothetical protein
MKLGRTVTHDVFWDGFNHRIIRQTCAVVNVGHVIASPDILQSLQKQQYSG